MTNSQPAGFAGHHGPTTRLPFGVRTWGNTAAGAAQLLVGTYPLHRMVGRRLTAALPPLAVLPGFGWSSGPFALLGEEIARKAPGQQVVLDRLLDLLLVAALRAWFARPEAAPPRWYVAAAAAADPVVEPPMAFLAGWRLGMAADLITETDDTLEAVARAVGYGGPFALSAAFKRFHGVSPQDFRRTAAATT